MTSTISTEEYLEDNEVIQEKQWFIKIGNGYFLDEHESKITFTLEDANNAKKFRDKQVAKNTASRIGGIVEIYKKDTIDRFKTLNIENIEYFILTQKRHKVLKYFIKHFKIQKKNNVEYIKANIAILNKVDDDVLNFGIARMKSLENTYDISSNLGYYVAILLALVSTFSSSNTFLYNAIYDSSNEINEKILLNMSLSPIIMIGIVGTIISVFALFLRNTIQTGAHIRSMLESALKNKK